jgi:hypothetical protein
MYARTDMHMRGMYICTPPLGANGFFFATGRIPRFGAFRLRSSGEECERSVIPAHHYCSDFPSRGGGNSLGEVAKKQ